MEYANEDISHAIVHKAREDVHREEIPRIHNEEHVTHDLDATTGNQKEEITQVAVLATTTCANPHQGTMPETPHGQRGPSTTTKKAKDGIRHHATTLREAQREHE